MRKPTATLLRPLRGDKARAYSCEVRRLFRPIERAVIGVLMTLLAAVLEQRVRSRLRRS